MNKIVPFNDNYHHFEGNSAAHIKSSMMGASEILSIEHGRFVLGRRQAVFFHEFDGPRNRSVLLKIISDRD